MKDRLTSFEKKIILLKTALAGLIKKKDFHKIIIHSTISI